MHCDVLPRRRAAGQDLLAIGRVVDLARVAGAADDAPAAEDAEEPGEDAAVLVRRPCGINRSVDGGEIGFSVGDGVNRFPMTTGD